MQDYALLKAFDINIFENKETTKKVTSFLINENYTSEFNKIKFKEGLFNKGDTETSMFFYSQNTVGEEIYKETADENVVDNENVEIKGSNTVYMLAHLKIEDPVQLNLITIEFTTPDGTKVYRKAYNYDYNYHRNIVPGADGTYNNELETEYLNRAFGNHVELVFVIDTIQSFINRDLVPTLVENEFQSRTELENYYGNITKIFIDSNNDSSYTEGEQTIEMV